MKSSFFEHFYDLTGPKYAEKYEDSEFDINSKHFVAKMSWEAFFGALVGGVEATLIYTNDCYVTQ